MKVLFTHIILLFACATLFGQKITYPDLKKDGLTVGDFVPNGWRMLAVSYGDLNKDKLQDVVLVIQNQHSDFIISKGNGEQAVEYDSNPRVLMVLFKKAKGGYSLEAYNNTFILRNSNPARIDPFLAVTINGSGILAIDFQFYYTSGDREMVNSTYKFRYQNNNLEMIGAEVMGVTKATGVSVDYSFNFMTRKMCVTSGNVLKSNKFAEEWQSFKLDNLKNLQSLLQPFTWEINGINL